MSSPLRGNIKMALATMRNARWRSFLTMLGIIVAVTSVVTIVGIGQGVKEQINGQIDSLGRDLITVRPGHQPTGESLAGGDFNALLGHENTGQLDTKDVDAVAKAEGVAEAVPLSLVRGEIKAGERKLDSPLTLGTTPELEAILNKPVEHGTFFTVESLRDEPNVAIIGSDVAKGLFGQRVPIGRSFEFLGNTFIVQGVLKRFDNTPLSLATDFNSTIFIPYSTAQTLTLGNAPIYQILARPENPAQLDTAVASVSRDLDKLHQGQQGFSVLRQEESLAVANTILGLLTKLIAGVAAVALLMGGIGIMNVMLVSVAERRHEIGIRKALGATSRQIAMQFMAEALVLSVIGAAIGILFSLLINFVVRIATNIMPVVDWHIMLIASGVSILVGILFGTAPALKAARKDPIDALRNE